MEADLRALNAALAARSAALAASEERYCLALEVNDQGAWDWDLASGEVTVNDRGYTLLGYAPGEVRTTFDLWRDSLHPEDAPAVERALADYLAGRAPDYQSEHRVVMKNGEIRWHRSKGRIVSRAADGTPTRLIGIMLDITDQKQRDAQLKETLDILRLALEIADIGLWSWDLDSGKLRWDERLCRWYEVPEETRRAGLYYDFWRSRLEPTDRISAERRFLEALASEGLYEDEFRLRLPEGRVRVIQTRAVIHRDPRTQGARVIGVNRDITAQREQEAELRQAKVAAEAANATKSRFLTAVTHELRTPLHTILGFSELLLGAVEQGQEGGQRLQTAATTLQRNARHLLALVNDILDLTRLERGRFEFHPRPVALHGLLRECLADLAPRATAKGLTLRMTIAPEVPPGVMLNPLRLRQILNNLLVNAIKFTLEGNIHLEAGAQAAGAGRVDLWLRVTDTGPGIPAEEAERIFEPFFQSATWDVPPSPRGYGVGLTLSRELALAMCGELRLDRGPPVGARFTLNLPALLLAELTSATDSDSGMGPLSERWTPVASAAPEVLAAPPAAALAELREWAMLGLNARIRAWCRDRSTPDHAAAFADRVMQLATRFEHVQILALVDAALQAQGDEGSRPANEARRGRAYPPGMEVAHPPDDEPIAAVLHANPLTE